MNCLQRILIYDCFFCWGGFGFCKGFVCFFWDQFFVLKRGFCIMWMWEFGQHRVIYIRRYCAMWSKHINASWTLKTDGLELATPLTTHEDCWTSRWDPKHHEDSKMAVVCEANSDASIFWGVGGCRKPAQAEWTLIMIWVCKRSQGIVGCTPKSPIFHGNPQSSFLGVMTHIFRA